MYRYQLLVLGFIAIAFAGCASYQAKPLTPEEIIREVEDSRQQVLLAPDEQLTFGKTAAWMSDHSPLLKQLKTEYETLAAVADIATPWSNPSIEIGPDYGSSLPAGASHKIQPFISLGFSIPIGDRLARRDDLNQAYANGAFIEVNITHRELYLTLRKHYVALYLAKRRDVVQKDIFSQVSQIAKLSRTLQQAGVMTALDVGMMTLAASQAELKLLRVNEEGAAIYSNISAFIGIEAKQFNTLPNNALGDITIIPPTYEALKALMIVHSPDLMRLRQQYDVAELKLRLAISKQYPDISLGFEREEDVGENSTILGLRIGLELPVFDRNMQGILQADRHRDEVRQSYITTVHKILAELRRTLHAVVLSEQQKKLLDEILLPQSKQNIMIAEQALKAGDIDALKYLEVKRGQQEVLKEVMQVQSDLWQSWIALEQAVGYPLLKLSGEDHSDYPSLSLNKEIKDE
jgi:outer membrane protein TolC